MKKFFSKRVLSFLLALMMIVGMLPASAITAFADEKAEIETELDSAQLIQGRAADGNAYFECGIEYRFGGGIYNVDLYPVPSDALKEKYPVGKDVTSWFAGGLPEGLTARISGYYGTFNGQGHIRPYIRIGLSGIPTETTAGRAVTITVPGDFYQDSQPVTFNSTIIIDPLGSACDGCTFKTINGMQVCYKEGKGIHVCETNFGEDTNTVGDTYDTDPQDGYISAEEEPISMKNPANYWYFFDIKHVDDDGKTLGTYYLDRFPNLMTVDIKTSAVVHFGANNTKLESIVLQKGDYSAEYVVKGFNQVPASAPLQKIEIKNATVDRYRYNFPMLEKLVLTGSVIDGELHYQIFITKDCAALKHIDLSGTDISYNSADTNIAYELSNLEYLDVSYTGIENVNIAPYSKLKYFYAKYNDLTAVIGARGEGGRTLADKCPELLEVDISGNNLTEFVLGEHQTIKKLNLSDNAFTNLSLNNLSSLKELYADDLLNLQTLYLLNDTALEVLSLQYTGVESGFQFTSGDADMTALKKLDVSGSPLSTPDWKKMPALEILDVSYCDNITALFQAGDFPCLRELYANKIPATTNGQFYVGIIPTLEFLTVKDSDAATASILAPNLKTLNFTESAITAMELYQPGLLQELVIEDNVNLEYLELDGCKSLQWLEAYGCDSLKGIDFTDCWSIRGVRVSADVNTVWPDGEDMPYEIDGWYTVKDDNSSKRSYHDHLKANREETSDTDVFTIFDYNVPNWKTGTDKWGKILFTDQDAIFNNALKIEYPYPIVYNLSPYKETSVNQYTFYAIEALGGNVKNIGMPGVVGWATKKFATEAEIVYRPGDMIYHTEAEPLELWPVYNKETYVNYDDVELVDGEFIYNSNEVWRDVVYNCSSFSDYWTYEISTIVPQREGYIFTGWSYDGVIYQPGDEIEFDVGNVAIYPRWEKVVEMPYAYTYLSCDKQYFENGDSITLTAKITSSENIDDMKFKAYLYLYEEGKESEKTKVAEKVFTGDEVDLTFTYPVDDTRIAYVEIFAYDDGGYSSQESITAEYTLTPATEMTVNFAYYIGDGYVDITEDTEIVLEQGQNDGTISLEVDAYNGKGELEIILYERTSRYGTATAISSSTDTEISTNSVGKKYYNAVVRDETGNTVYTKYLTVNIVPSLEASNFSDDATIAIPQDVMFTLDYVGYVGDDGEYLKEIYVKKYVNGSYVDIDGAYLTFNPSGDYTGTLAVTVPVSAPASGDTEENCYYVYGEDIFGNRFEYEFYAYFDRSDPLTFAAEYRADVLFYDYYSPDEYKNVYTAGDDVVIKFDGDWVYDITDSLYNYDRSRYPDNVLIPSVGDGVEVGIRIYRYASYEDYKAGGSYENVYLEEFSGSSGYTFDSNGYLDISERCASNANRLPDTIDFMAALSAGYYTVGIRIVNTSAAGYYDEGYCFDIYGSATKSVDGAFEVLADGAEHVHDYKVSYAYNGPDVHSYSCFCGATYEEAHVFESEYPDDGLWPSERFSYYDENGNIAYADSNLDRRLCTTCVNYVYRWRFIESFTIGNADLQEGQTNSYEKVMSVDQTTTLVTNIDFLEELNPLMSANTMSIYTEKMADFLPPNTKINWTSSNQDVAVVDENGNVTTVGEGTALITGTTVQPNKETGEPMTVTILINVNCKHTAHKVKVPAQEPTCQADGHIEHYMCLDCNRYSLTGDFTDTVSYENDIKLAKVDHAKLYGVWHSDENGHWRECKYGCGTRYDEESHISGGAATCQHPESCSVCGYQLNPIVDHSHSEYGWSDSYHWSICDCGVVVTGSNQVHQFGADGSSDTCDICGYKKNVGYTVSGTITSYLKAEDDITVQLLSGEEVAYSQVFNTYTEVNASKKEYSTVYSIPAVVDGTYTLRISKADHVTRDYTVTVNGGVLTQDAKIHLKGDINGDGKVSSVDKKLIYNHLNDNSKALTGYEFDVGNLNGDTKISSVDKKLIYSHISGDKPLWE